MSKGLTSWQRLALALLWVAGGCLSCVAAPSAGGTRDQTTSARMEAARLGISASAVRLELDFQDARRPLWELAYEPRQRAVRLILRDVVGATLPAAQRDVLAETLDLRRPAPLQAEYTVHLAYPVPAGCVRVQESRGGLVLEVSRDFDEQLSCPLTGRVQWRRREVRAGGAYYLLNELEVDTRAPGVSLGLVHGRDTLEATEPPSSMAERTRALALVNGGFFRFGGGGAGLVMEAGRVLKPPVSHRPPRTALGITRQGDLRVDRVAVQGGAAVALSGVPWVDVVTALGGGPRLVRDGRVEVTADAEGLGRGGNNITHPCGRTAVAILRNGHLLLVTLSGFSDNHSEGWTLETLARWLVERGAVDAMGFDGGGSTAMVVDSVLVSRGWGNQKPERPVANAWIVRDDAPRRSAASILLTVQPPRLTPGSPAIARVEAQVTDASGQMVPDGTVVHFFAPVGRVVSRATTVQGRVKVDWTCLVSPGDRTLTCYAGLTWAEARLHFDPGAPTVLRAWSVVEKPDGHGGDPSLPQELSPLPKPTPLQEEVGRGTSRVEAVVADAWFNPLSGQQVTFVDAATGQVLGSACTDAAGCVSWQPDGGRVPELLVRCQGTLAVRVQP